MTETYTGWDGKPYPWPPPEGWYEASDGRWWAPGTGPNPPGAEDPAGMPSGGPAPSAPHEAEPTAMAEEVARTAQLPSDVVGSAPGAAASAAGVTVASGAEQAGIASSPPPNLGGAAGTTGTPPGGGSDDWTNQWEEPSSLGGEPEERGALAKIGLVLAGVVAALAVAGGAYLLLRDSGSETAAESGDTTTTDSASETTDGDGSGTDGGSGSTATTEDTAGSDTTPTTADDTGSTDDETSTTADTSTQVLEFRNILTANGLTSSGLSDQDISTFGNRFCVFAVASEDEAEYRDFRQQAIETTSSELTDEELFTVVDAAVAVFCPDEAERLGINP